MYPTTHKLSTYPTPGAAAANVRGDRAARGGNNVENGVQGNTRCLSKCKGVLHVKGYS